MNNHSIRIILVSGMSGAGKTTTMGVLEDMGYHCMDQFPVKLLPSLTELITTTNDPRYLKVALSTNLLDFEAFRQVLGGLGVDLSILLLEASHGELLKRYKFSRRTHPMLLSNLSSTLEEGIQYEEELLSQLKDQNTISLDTSYLNATELKQRLNKVFATSRKPVFSISFISFGYKNGVPLDADLLFDVRFLPNPHWDEALRPYNGNDQVVYDYVMGKPETQKFLRKLTGFLDYAFKEYVKEGKNHFTVGIGCTGGKHRSVALTNWLTEHYAKKYQTFKDHRDLE